MRSGRLAARGRPYAVGGAILAGVVLLASLALGAGGPARAQDGATPAPDAVPLDLAAMALTPADLEAAGLAGFGIRAGRTPTRGEIAQSVARFTGGETAAARQTLDAAGWWHGYELTLATTPDPAAQRPPVAASVAVRLAEYVTADGAAAGFAFLEDEAGAQVGAGTPTPQDVPGSRAIGDQSEITVTQVQAGGATVQVADLAFRSGAVTAGVTVAAGGDAPDVARLEALADRLLAKIEAVRAQGAPDLGPRALRLGGRGATINDDAYLRLDGRDLPLFAETPAETSARTARFGDASSVYDVAQRVAAGERERTDDVVYSTTLHRFVSPPAASAWLQDAQGRLDQTAGFQDVQPIADAQALGEESVAFSYGAIRRAGPFRGFVALVRVGTDVAEIRLEALVQAPRAAIDELARAQADCLVAPTCARTRPPASIAPPAPATPAAGTPTP